MEEAEDILLDLVFLEGPAYWTRGFKEVADYDINNPDVGWSTKLPTLGDYQSYVQVELILGKGMSNEAIDAISQG